jgi:hypothetical protein
MLTSLSNNPGILAFALLPFVAMALFRWGHSYWEKRIRNWAFSEGLTLIEFRGAKFYEGPSALIRSENQQVFRATFADDKGQQREAWLTFGSYANPFTQTARPTQVRWD